MCTASMYNKAEGKPRLYIPSTINTDYILWQLKLDLLKYLKVLSSNTSRLEAHVGFFRLLMKRTFDPYVL